MKGHIRAGLVAAISVAVMAVGASSAFGWNPAGVQTFSTLNGGGATQLTTTLTGGTTLTSDATFTANLVAGTTDLLTVTATTYLNSRSSTGLATTVTSLDLPWPGFGVGIGATGDVAVGPTFLSTLRDAAGATVGTLTLRGIVTGNYNSRLAPNNVGAVTFLTGGDLLRVIAATGVAAPLLGAAGDLTGVVTTRAAGPVLQ